MLVAVLVGTAIAVIVNSEWTNASDTDTVQNMTVITKTGCKPSKRICYTAQEGDSIVTYKGRYKEKTVILK